MKHNSMKHNSMKDAETAGVGTDLQRMHCEANVSHFTIIMRTSIANEAIEPRPRRVLAPSPTTASKQPHQSEPS